MAKRHGNGVRLLTAVVYSEYITGISFTTIFVKVAELGQYDGKRTSLQAVPYTIAIGVWKWRYLPQIRLLGVVPN